MATLWSGQMITHRIDRVVFEMGLIESSRTARYRTRNPTFVCYEILYRQPVSVTQFPRLLSLSFIQAQQTFVIIIAQTTFTACDVSDWGWSLQLRRRLSQLRYSIIILHIPNVSLNRRLSVLSRLSIMKQGSYSIRLPIELEVAICYWRGWSKRRTRVLCRPPSPTPSRQGPVSLSPTACDEWPSLTSRTI